MFSLCGANDTIVEQAACSVKALFAAIGIHRHAERHVNER
jgi:hypothetical protein